MIAKYEIIKQDIKKKITDGEFHPGEKIYSEGDLRKLYNVSSTTVIKALNDLVNEGYLIRKQGEGTYVRRNIKHRKVSFSENLKLDNKNLNEETITIVDSVENDEYIIQLLGSCKKKSSLLKITQISLIDNHPWKLQERYLLSDKLNNEAILRLTEQGSSVSKELHLNKNLMEHPMKMDISVELVSADSDKISALKKINRSFGDEPYYALFSINRLISDNRGTPIEYTHQYIDPTFYHIGLESD